METDFARYKVPFKTKERHAYSTLSGWISQNVRMYFLFSHQMDYTVCIGT